VFIELVDHLRCTRPHEHSWLVAAARRMEARHVVDGELGCPVCHAEYPVRDAVADFAEETQSEPSASGAGDAMDGSDDELLRAAALLQLVEVRRPVVVAGAWAALLPRLVELVPATYLAVNATASLPLRPELSALRARGTLPLARGVAHAVALDAAAADEGLLRGAVAALRPGGRLVAPAAVALPAGVRELARDERHWVAERAPDASVTAPVPLARRG
jgi:hypothetical protein